jgi:hypothetical protein
LAACDRAARHPRERSDERHATGVIMRAGLITMVLACLLTYLPSSSYAIVGIPSTGVQPAPSPALKLSRDSGSRNELPFWCVLDRCNSRILRLGNATAWGMGDGQRSPDGETGEDGDRCLAVSRGHFPDHVKVPDLWVPQQGRDGGAGGLQRPVCHGPAHGTGGGSSRIGARPGSSPPSPQARV